MYKLKPCPFCGSSADISEGGTKAKCADDHKIYCDASEQWFDADWWETRKHTIESELIGLIDKCLDMIDGNGLYVHDDRVWEEADAIKKRMTEIQKEIEND